MSAKGKGCTLTGMDLLNAALLAWRCFQRLRRGQMALLTVSKHGVPCGVALVACDREAWQVSDYAIGYFASRGIRTEVQ